MHFREFVSFVFLAFAIYSPLVFARVNSVNLLHIQPAESSSSFSVALDMLQQRIDYKFKSIGLLRRAMTHASYSEENNKVLSILGAKVMETSVSLRLLGEDVDISSKELNRQISNICNVEFSCAANGMRLGMQKVVRVSPKTNSSTPAVVCGAFRAVFGAIAIDVESSDNAGSVFWKVHGDHIGKSSAR